MKAAAKRADLPASVLAHWLRHAHAAHSLKRGAPIHLVQATPGRASGAVNLMPNKQSRRRLNCQVKADQSTRAALVASRQVTKA